MAVSSLALPDAIEDPPSKMGIDLEGLKTTPWILGRADLCKQLCALVEVNRLLLVRAPFASGKTSLAQLLQRYLRAEHAAYVVSLADGDVPSWSECWFQQTGTPWKVIKSSAKLVYVIIDEVQDSYPETSMTHGLWKDIKGLGKQRMWE